MECVNCRTDDSIAFTLRAHTGDTRENRNESRHEGSTVDLRFCSFECLDTWV